MTSHVLAVVYLAALLFQIGSVFGVPKDPRPWNAARVASLVSGALALACGVWLAVDAL